MIERVVQTLITTGEDSRAIRRVAKVNAVHRCSQLQTMPKPMQVQDGTGTVSLVCHGKKTASRVRHSNGHCKCMHTVFCSNSRCGCTQSSTATATVNVRSFLTHYGCTQSSQPPWMYTFFYSNSHCGCTQISQPPYYGCTQSSQPLWMYTVFCSNSHCRCTQFSQLLWMYTVFSATVDVHGLLRHCGCTQSSVATVIVDEHSFQILR